jgi:hypothetical protein
MKKIHLFLGLVLFASCSAYQEIPLSNILDRTIGKSEHDILVAMGPPKRIDPDGSGGKILSYENTFIFKENDLNTVPYSNTLTTSVTLPVTHYLQFYIDKDDKVYHYRTNYEQTIKVIKDQNGKIIKIKTS